MSLESILRSDERAIFRLRELYHQHGYTHFKMSKFEEYDLYVRNKSFLVSENILTFTDTDGKLMALKPDVTLSIIKNTREGNGALQKVYYNETVYRVSPTSHCYQEIVQTGLECVGDLDLYTVAEVLHLAAESLSLIGEEYLLDLGHLGFAGGLLESAGVNEGDQKKLLHWLSQKNTSAIWSAGSTMGLPVAVKEDLCRLANLYGPPDVVLPELESMVRCFRMDEALKELQSICGLLADCCQHLRLDFSIVNDMCYYNSVIFRGYLPGLPGGVLSGGRYDSLLKKMGKTGGAIGFAVYLNDLERLNTRKPEYDGDVLLLYGPEASSAAVMQAARACREAGLSVRVDRSVPEGMTFREIREVKV